MTSGAAMWYVTMATPPATAIPLVNSDTAIQTESKKCDIVRNSFPLAEMHTLVRQLFEQRQAYRNRRILFPDGEVNLYLHKMKMWKLAESCRSGQFYCISVRGFQK